MKRQVSDRELLAIRVGVGVTVTVLDLSRIYAAPIARLGCLAFEGQGAFAPQS